MAIDEAVEQMQQQYAELLGDQPRTVQDVGDDLRRHWQAADEINLRLYSPVDVTTLAARERKAHERRMRRKVGLYDALRAVGIDLYKRAGKRFLRRTERHRDGLAASLDAFCVELKGAGHGMVDRDVYQRVLESMPPQVREDPRFSDAVQQVRARAGEQYAAGLRGEMRSLARQARFHADLDDILEASVAQYDQKMGEVSKEIKGLSEGIVKEPHNAELLQRRAGKVAMYNAYEAERDKYMDWREQEVHKLRRVQKRYDVVGRQVQLRDIAIMRSRASLERIDTAIAFVKEYVGGRADVAQMQRFLGMVETADTLSLQAEAVAAQGDSVARIHYDRLLQGSDPSESWAMIQGRMKARQREDVERFKQKVRQAHYA